ncbi:uncharacterized protein LOC110464018 [Mizuhopecten yessoensis]|uniref:E3 ubiquitin-protein ligase TRIM56 n=1 Tax=Mizuhopecten yessoensis TaxID=6573 RepID=A0A210PUX9_MIZYE|nr:uncharacterized protein LOC110464018 [Mizuhopecten yessoensis]OWF40266.1 E3 ubiquitin-protein ligase TRIM56 [Mizuhopecten yessoensis]
MASKLAVRRAQVHVPDTCALCESIQDVNWYCNDCQEALCDKCKDGHKRGKKTRNDDVVPIRQAEKQNEVLVILPKVCMTHPGKLRDLLCTECHVLMCSMCFAQKHKRHTFKHIEEEIDSQKQYMRGQLETLKSKLDHFDDNLAKRHEANKAFKDSVDVIRKVVQAQGAKLKAEVDSIVNSVLAELSSLIAEEDESYKRDCQPYQKNVKEIKQLIRDVEQRTEQMSSTTLFELTGKLRNTIPLYDVTCQNIHSRPPTFVSGQLNTKKLEKMVGYVSAGYKKKDIDSQHVKKMSSFQAPQQSSVISICPTDDNHAWMSVLGSKELVKTDKKGKVTDSLQLDFKPLSLALINTTELLITCRDSSLIYILSNDRQIMTFADISPFKACCISVNDCDKVFVTTRTSKILALNKSGNMIRKISCGQIGIRIVCLTAGNFAVATGDGGYCNELMTVNKSDQIIRTWSGELDNGQKIEQTLQCSIARDRYDRVFVPDFDTDQVYVLSGNEAKAKCLLEKKHRVIQPMAVCVDRCGHVWVGCVDGTVHVMEL